MKITEYKNWTIFDFAHPKLQGRYSIINPDGDEICRSYTIKELKNIINSMIKNERNKKVF